jgi:hypothetical protein
MEIFLFLAWHRNHYGHRRRIAWGSGFGWFLLGCLFNILASLAVLVMPSRKRDLNVPTPKTYFRGQYQIHFPYVK